MRSDPDPARSGEGPTASPPDSSALPVPVRVRLSRAKGWRMPPNTVKVDRSTRWGNHDFIVGEDGDAEDCAEMFWHDLDKFSVFHPDEHEAYMRPLVGKNLACWCALDAPCHADALLHHARECVAKSEALGPSDRTGGDDTPGMNP